MTATTDRTKERADRAQRNLRSLLTDSAYATIGAGGAAIEFVRSIDRFGTERARNLGKDAPSLLRQLREQGITTARTLREQGMTGARDLREQAAREFEDLAKRGRGLVGSVRDSAAVRQAVSQTRTARSRVKAAGTSVGRAAQDTAKAAEQAGTIVADRTEPSTHRATTSTGGRRGGAIRPYEERTVEELRERARELRIEGHSTMTKDELIAALRKQR